MTNVGVPYFPTRSGTKKINGVRKIVKNQWRASRSHHWVQSLSSHGGGFLKMGGTPTAGWFISWKIDKKMDDNWGYQPWWSWWAQSVDLPMFGMPSTTNNHPVWLFQLASLLYKISQGISGFVWKWETPVFDVELSCYPLFVGHMWVCPKTGYPDVYFLS